LIKDDASSALFRLRGNIRTTRERARAVVEGLSGSKKLRDFLRDDIFTISDDRYVLCVAAGHHTRLPGVVHGRSGSGLTYFR
jgi:DNA mismatch repair protein MutS2